MLIALLAKSFAVLKLVESKLACACQLLLKLTLSVFANQLSG